MHVVLHEYEMGVWPHFTASSFSFNADFSAPMQKIKISTVSSRPESNDERKETRDHIDEERRHQTDVSAWIQVGRDERADFVRAGLHRAHHEGPKAVWAQRPHQRGDPAALFALPPQPAGHQEANREPNRGMSALGPAPCHRPSDYLSARIPRTLRRPQVVQLSGVSFVSLRVAACSSRPRPETRMYALMCIAYVRSLYHQHCYIASFEFP